MEIVPLMTLSSCLKIDPLSLLRTSTGYKPTIFINRRNNTRTFHHQPSSFPSGHLQVMCGHRSRHVVKAVGMHGDEEYVRKSKARGVAGATLVFACVVGAMCFTRPMCRPAVAKIWSFWSSKPPMEEENLPEQEVRENLPTVSTLEFFLKEANRKKNDKEASEAQKRLDDMLKKITGKDFYTVDLRELKNTARMFAWNTDRRKAKTVLDNLEAKYKDLLASSGGYGEGADTLGKILVEMKIFLGMQTEAEEELKKLMAAAKLSENDLKGDLPKLYVDLRLYKAVISLMSNKKDDALFWWNIYKPSAEQVPDTRPDHKSLFEQFEAKLRK